MHRIIRLFSIIILVLTSSVILAQNATIRGFIYEDKTGEPVLYCNVFLEGTTLGASTDENGYFHISPVPKGDYTLKVRYVGYDSLTKEISLNPQQVLTLKLYLKKSSRTLDEFRVSAERQAAKTETKTSVVKVTPKQINQLPSIGGQPDLAQYLQVLPGVVSTGDQGGQLYIRGGSPIQNKVLLDGMIIYNPFHSIGLFSVFDTDILKTVDVYTGGFGSEYGGRISSIMDIKTRDGNKKELKGKIGASPFGAKLLLEGPIGSKKNKDSHRKSDASYIFSLKNSYLSQTSKVLYNYIDTNGLPFNFNDLYGKISINSSNGSKINFFGFNFNDNVNYRALSNFNWRSYGGGTNFVVIPGNSPVLIDGSFSYSSYNIALEDEGSLPRESKISGFNSNLGFTYFLGKNQFKYGIEMLGFTTDYFFYNIENRSIGDRQNTTELAGYLKYKHTWGKLLTEIGIRGHYYASLSEFSPEPRIAMKLNATDNLRFKMAAGLYSQNLIAANSDRDVVNLFYGFISGPDNLPENFNGERVTSSLQRSRHFILGFEYDIGRYLSLNLEGYIKDFPQLTQINRNKIFEDNADYSDKPDYFKKDFIVESGNAEGFDISLKYDKKQLYIWAVYSLGFINRFDGYVNYVPHFDRRHNTNFLASYTFGKTLLWESSMRWNYGSGFPFTPTQGNFEKLPFEDGINIDYIIENGILGVLYGDLNSGRLPSYHRLDATLKRRFVFVNDSELDISLSVTNLYNRGNIFYVDRITNSRVNQLPFMPSLGINYSF